jgi:soluble lytic murein transglycosylase-like protein
MLRTRYKAEIDVAASKWGLDPLLVEAVVVQESGGNTDAFRFEPDYWNRYLKGNPKYRGLNPRRVSSSYGLMQVMYSRLLEDRVADNDAWEPELLFIPVNGLDLGCGLLHELSVWANGLAVTDAQLASEPALYELVALAAYNGGKGGNDPTKNWPLRNGKYARDVLAKKALLIKEYATL